MAGIIVSDQVVCDRHHLRLSYSLQSPRSHCRSVCLYLPRCGHQRGGGCVLFFIVQDGSSASHGDVRRIPKPTVSNRSLGPTPVCYCCTATPPKSSLEISISVFDTNGSRTSNQSRSIRKCTWGARLTDSGKLVGEATTQLLRVNVRRRIHALNQTLYRDTESIPPGCRSVQNNGP